MLPFGARKTQLVELGGIEPPSIRRRLLALRPFPTSKLTQLHRRVGCPSLLADHDTSFRAVSGLSRRQWSFLLPFSASVAGLR